MAPLTSLSPCRGVSWAKTIANGMDPRRRTSNCKVHKLASVQSKLACPPSRDQQIHGQFDHGSWLGMYPKYLRMGDHAQINETSLPTFNVPGLDQCRCQVLPTHRHGHTAAYTIAACSPQSRRIEMFGVAIRASKMRDTS
eukprot:6403449-Amphidinium_carterae.1